MTMEDTDETPPEPETMTLEVRTRIALADMRTWLHAKAEENVDKADAIKYVQLLCLLDHLEARERERPQMLAKTCEANYHSCGKCRWCAMREVGG